MRTVDEERALNAQLLLKKMSDQNDIALRKVQKFKYEAQALKNCRDTAIMMGEKMVKQGAEE